MKKAFLLVVALIVNGATFTAWATTDTKSSNAKVQSAFEKQFPGAEVFEWTIEDDGKIKVSFSMDGISHEAFYNTNGVMTEEWTHIEESDLPEDVVDYLTEHNYYDGVYSIIKAEDKAKKVTYMVLVDLNDTDNHLFFNSEGAFLSKNVIKTENIPVDMEESDVDEDDY